MSTETIDTDSKELWETAKRFFLMTLRSPDEKSLAERYFDMITSVARERDVFTLYTSSNFAANKIRDEYATRLKGAFMMSGCSPSIEIKVKDDSVRLSQIVITPPRSGYYQPTGGYGTPTTEPRTRQFISTMPLNEDYTFSSFVRGPSNSYAVSAAEGVVKNPAKPGYNPLFIHGGTGLGKTHLMQAIGNELRKRNPGMAICYLTSETFLNEYVTSLQNGQIEQFRHKYRSIDLLLIDDIQFLAQKNECQVEFFNTFNALKDNHKQIVMTSDVAPKNLPSIESRLISRFEGGMVQEVESPSYETRLAILRKKTESSDVYVKDNVLMFIANNIKSHVRAMEGALNRVTIAISAEPQLELNNETLGRLLKDYIEKERTMRKLSIDEIQMACAKKFRVTIDDLLSHERTQSIVTPRQLAMFISRKLTSKGLQEIATSFGKKHATIINGVRTISERLGTEPELKRDLEEILSSFGYRLSDITD